MSHLSEAIRMAGMRSLQDDDTFDPDRDLDDEHDAPSLEEDIDSSFAALAAMFDDEPEADKTPHVVPPSLPSEAPRRTATTRPAGPRPPPPPPPLPLASADEGSRVTVRVPPPPSPADDVRERMTVRVPSTPKIRLRAPEAIELELDEPGIDVAELAPAEAARIAPRPRAGGGRAERARDVQPGAARSARPEWFESARATSLSGIEREPLGTITTDSLALVVYRSPSFLRSARPVQIIEAPTSPLEMGTSCSAPSFTVHSIPAGATTVARLAPEAMLGGEPPRPPSGRGRSWTAVSVAVMAAAALVSLAVQQRVGPQAPVASAPVAISPVASVPVAPAAVSPLLAQVPPAERPAAAPRPAKPAEPPRPEHREESSPATAPSPARAPRRAVAPTPTPTPAPAPEAVVSQSGRIMGNEEQ